MGKRSNFERNPRDYYKTPESAVLPLLDHLPHQAFFIEPCAGDGALVNILEKHGHHCVMKTDIEPQHPDIFKVDALAVKRYVTQSDCIITNPPWEKRKHKGEMFNKLLRHWLKYYRHDIWLLFDADWMHTKQAQEFMQYCFNIVSVGRVSWMDNGTSGLDNCAWYMFSKYPKLTDNRTNFYFRK